MVLDHLENSDRYVNLHPGFAIAFAFLKRKNLGELSPGRHDVDGDRVYAVVVRGEGHGRKEAMLEAHRKYIDIQFTLSGTDVIGWKPVKQCVRLHQSYDEKKDCALFTDACDAWVTTHPGSFAIFFPDDAHAPMSGEGHIHKIVLKVPLAWHH